MEGYTKEKRDLIKLNYTDLGELYDAYSTLMDKHNLGTNRLYTIKDFIEIMGNLVETIDFGKELIQFLKGHIENKCFYVVIQDSINEAFLVKPDKAEGIMTETGRVFRFNLKKAKKMNT